MHRPKITDRLTDRKTRQRETGENMDGDEQTGTLNKSKKK